MKYVMYICDRCGKEFPEAAGTLYPMTLSVDGGAHPIRISEELCRQCAESLVAAVYPRKSEDAIREIVNAAIEGNDEEGQAGYDNAPDADCDDCPDTADDPGEDPELLEGDNYPWQLDQKEQEADDRFGAIRTTVAEYFADSQQPIRFKEFILKCRNDLKITTDKLAKGMMLNSNNVYTAVSTGKCFPFIRRAVKQYYGVEVE